MFRRIADAAILALLVAVSLPLLAVRSLLVRRSRPAPQPQTPSPHQFAFHRALLAYEALLDAAAADYPAARRP